MADFYFTGNGVVRTGGCAATKSIKLIPVNFRVNDQAFVVSSAIKGVLERVIIKEVIAVRNHKTFNQYLVKYKDTWNRIYFEGDLLDEYDALVTVQKYLEAKQADINAHPPC